MRKIILILLMVIGYLTGFAEEVITYEKVVSAPADWSGEYLIVYEASDTEAYILNSQLTTSKEYGNPNSFAIKSFLSSQQSISFGNVETYATLTGFSISGLTTEDMLFTITKQKNEKYSILGRSNKYIGSNSSGEIITNQNNIYPHSISINSSDIEITHDNNKLRFKFTGTNPTNFGYFATIYASYKRICLYKKTITYKRNNLTVGNYGTICLPCAIKTADRSGAVFYNIAGTKKDANGDIIGIVLTEETGDLAAGKPYIFKATNTKLSATYSGERTTVQNGNGLVGNLSEGTMDVPNGKYILSGNELHQIAEAATATVGTNRAYIDMESLSEYQGNVKGQVYFGLDGEIINDVSMIRENTNHLIYDLSGRIVTKPTSGLYIMNNKKIILK